MGRYCPCADLKRGAADLAIAASALVQSQIFFGGSFASVVTAALHGSASLAAAALLIIWAATLIAGLVESLLGWRAVQAHRDPFTVDHFVIALAVGLACVYALYAGWSLPLEWGAFFAAGSRSALLAVAAYNATEVCLQLRGPVALLFAWRPAPRNDPPPDNGFLGDLFRRREVEAQDAGAAAQLAEFRAALDDLAREAEQHKQAAVTWEQERAAWDNERAAWQDAVAERDRAITEIASERDRHAQENSRVAVARDRFQSNGRKLLAEVKHLRNQADELRSHADAIRKVPGGWKAVSKAVHPDTGPQGDSAARTEIFKLVKHILGER
jgi:hypothetical protein